MSAFEFDVTLDELLESKGPKGLNNLLDRRMSQDPEYDYSIATQISYEPVLVTPGNPPLMTIRATFTLASLSSKKKSRKKK